jgi:ribokinase
MQGVDLAHVREVADASTGTAIITVAKANNTIIVVPGANALVSAADVSAPTLRQGDVAVSQFEIPQSAITAFFTRARASGAITILNPAPAMPIDRELMAMADVLILNESELGLLAGVELDDTAPDARFVAAASTLQIDHRPNICVTLGKRGVIALIDGDVHSEAGRPVKAIDTTGAGDCFVGVIAAQLADGHSLQSAIGYANVAASLCVQRMGAGPSMPTAQEVSNAIG